MLGPIMLMQPSKRQRRLAQLRSAALDQGLKVRMEQAPEGTPHAPGELAVYYLAWPANREPVSRWLLARRAYSHGIHFAGEWDWAEGKSAAPASQAALREALEGLPKSVVAVECASYGLGAYWLETTGGGDPEAAVAAIGHWLRDLAEQVPLKKRH